MTRVIKKQKVFHTKFAKIHNYFLLQRRSAIFVEWNYTLFNNLKIDEDRDRDHILPYFSSPF